jgi:16S rRNA processing protein RimM
LRRVRIGRVLRASGLQGDLRIQLFRPRRKPLTLEKADRLTLAGDRGEQAYVIERAKLRDPSNAIVHLEGIGDRTEAERLAGAFVDIDASDPPGGICDGIDRLIDARVIDDRGADVGTVEAIEDNGAQAILVVRGEGKRALVPYVDAFILGVDAGEPPTIRVQLIEGLIEED